MDSEAPKQPGHKFEWTPNRRGLLMGGLVLVTHAYLQWCSEFGHEEEFHPGSTKEVQPLDDPNTLSADEVRQMSERTAMDDAEQAGD